MSTAAGTAVWQLRPLGLDTGTINSPDAVRIPADSVLLLGDPTRCGGVVEFAAVNFKGAAPRLNHKPASLAGRLESSCFRPHDCVALSRDGPHRPSAFIIIGIRIINTAFCLTLAIA